MRAGAAAERASARGLLAWGALLLATLTPFAAEAATPVVASGTAHTLSVRADGTLYAWGSNGSGQLGDGTTTNRLNPAAVNLPNGASATAIAAGNTHSLAVGNDGKVYAWGGNANGQLGDGTTTDRLSPVAITLPGGVLATAVAAGYYHSLALGNDGQVYAWGGNSYGQLGDGTITQRPTPAAVTLPNGARATAIAAGFRYSLAVGNDGKVYAWGDNVNYQLGDGTQTIRRSPVTVTLPGGALATSIAANGHSLAVASDGKIYAWGYNGSGQLGDGTTSTRSSPVAVTLPNGALATAVSAGPNHSVAVGNDGKVYAWGRNAEGELGDGTVTHHPSPVAVTLPNGALATAATAGSNFSLAIGDDGKLYVWGDDLSGQLLDGTTTQRLSPVAVTLPNGTLATAVAAEFGHSLAIGSDGQVYSWGGNGSGQVGDGTTTHRSSPAAVTLPNGGTAVAAGYQHSLAVGTDGKVYAWGDNTYSELGDGTTTQRLNPVAVTLPNGALATAVAAGHYHSLAVGDDGKVYAWGWNSYGQLGDGTATTRSSPVAVTLPNGARATAVAAGGVHSLALGDDGKVYAWGYNIYGQLGDGTTTQRLSPVAVTLPNGVIATAIARGLYHSLAIGSDGQAYAWGYNNYAQLGDGTTTARSSPAAVSLPNGALATAVAGYDHSLAVGNDGKVYAWGFNNHGQLGDGTTTQRSSAVAVTLPDGATPAMVAAGQYHSLAIDSNGKLYAWGWSVYGQLGDSWRTFFRWQPDTAFVSAGHPLSLAPATTTTTLALANGTPLGTALTASVSVSPASATGSVTVSYSGAASGTLCTFTLSAGSGSCSLALPHGGAYTLTATYSGDIDYAVSTSAGQPLTVAPLTQTLTVSDPGPQVYGRQVTLTAGVDTGLGVSFTALDTSLCTVADHGDNTATVTLVGVGSCPVRASQAGTSDYAAIAQDIAFTVNKATASVTLDATAATTSGQAFSVPVTFTSDAGPSASNPIGLITVIADTGGSCTVGAAAAKAKVNCGPLTLTSVGTRTLGVMYGGDSHYTSFLSGSAGTHVVNAIATTTTVSPVNPASAVYGQPVQVTVTVNAGSGSTYPGGTVNVTATDGSTAATCSGALAQTVGAQSAATCTLTPALPVGSYTVSAAYLPGSATFAASSSNGAGDGSLTVTAAGTTLQLTTNPATPTAGVGAQLRAQLTATSPSTAIPTGTVNFQAGGVTVCSTVSVDGTGLAVCNYTFATSGSHSPSATYTPANGNFSASSGGATVTVNSLASTTTITAVSMSNLYYGNNVAVSVAVTGSSGTPTGNVVVQAGGPSGPSCTVTLNGSGVDSCQLLPTAGSPTALTATYQGDATYGGSSGSYNVTVAPATPAVTLTASAEPSVAGDGVTLTATVSKAGSSSLTPTGTVDFGRAGCASQPLNGSGIATCATSFATAGSYPLTAQYSGDGNYTAATGTATHVVNTAPTTTSVNTVSPASPVFGQAIDVAVTVQGDAVRGAPAGSVAITLGGQSCTVTSFTTTATSASGHCALTGVGAGNNQPLTATFTPSNGVYAGSGAGAQVTVAPATTTTTLASSANPAVVGAAVTFTATVTSPVGTPGGSVVFTVDGVAQTVSLNGSGQATFTPGSLAVGNHTVLAAYQASANYQGSTSAPLTQAITQATSAVAVSVLTASPVVGQSVTVGVTVTGYGTPTGSVTVSGGGSGCSLTLAGGSGQCSLTLAGGTHTLTASYAGDTNNAAGSGSAQVTVTPAATTTTLASSANPAAVGTAVTFTATVTSPAGTPGGSVVFTVDGTPQTVSLNGSGQATFTPGSLAVGNHTVLAAYQASANYQGSTSAPLTQAVAQAASTVAVSVLTASPVAGQSITVGVTVTGYGPPTGTVTVSGGGANCSLTLVGGSGQCSLTLAAGTHVLTASYAGDANNAPGSGSASVVVGQRSTTTALTANPNPAATGQAVTLIATVTGAGATPGAISFYEGAVSLGSAPVAGGTATLTLSGLSLGNHSLSAQYAGDSEAGGSTSAPLLLTVVPAAAVPIMAPLALGALGVGLVGLGAGRLRRRAA